MKLNVILLSIYMQKPLRETTNSSFAIPESRWRRISIDFISFIASNMSIQNLLLKFYPFAFPWGDLIYNITQSFTYITYPIQIRHLSPFWITKCSLLYRSVIPFNSILYKMYFWNTLAEKLFISSRWLVRLRFL